jgi:hypothetical protein
MGLITCPAGADRFAPAGWIPVPQSVSPNLCFAGDKMGAQILAVICPLFYELNYTFA